MNREEPIGIPNLDPPIIEKGDLEQLWVAYCLRINADRSRENKEITKKIKNGFKIGMDIELMIYDIMRFSAKTGEVVYIGNKNIKFGAEEFLTEKRRRATALQTELYRMLKDDKVTENISIDDWAKLEGESHGQ